MLFECSSYLAWFSHSKDKAQIQVEQFRSVFTKMGNFGPPGVSGIWVEGLFILRELGSTCNYFRGGGEQAHRFGSFREPCQKVKHKFYKSHLKGKASILFDFLKKSSSTSAPGPSL